MACLRSRPRKCPKPAQGVGGSGAASGCGGRPARISGWTQVCGGRPWDQCEAGCLGGSPSRGKTALAAGVPCVLSLSGQGAASPRPQGQVPPHDPAAPGLPLPRPLPLARASAVLCGWWGGQHGFRGSEGCRALSVNPRPPGTGLGQPGVLPAATSAPTESPSVARPGGVPQSSPCLSDSQHHCARQAQAPWSASLRSHGSRLRGGGGAQGWQQGRGSPRGVGTWHCGAASCFPRSRAWTELVVGPLRTCVLGTSTLHFF